MLERCAIQTYKHSKNYDGDKESQISETTETLESNARRPQPTPTVPLNGIQAQLQERLRAISEKNKSIQIKSDAVRDTPFPRKKTLYNLVDPQIVSSLT